VTKKRVLLKDIAERSGLTINTVSRALKDKNDISVTTRKEIQRLAVEMGYVPDSIASSLRSGYTKTIGIVFDNIANPYFTIMTELIYEELIRDGYDMMIFTSSGERAQFDTMSFNKMVSRRIDGIITFLKPTTDVVELARQNRIPLVILGREGDDIGVDSVYTDDYLGGYRIGEHLSQQGHKKIGYIGAPRDILCSLKRHEGMSDYLRKNADDKTMVEAIYLEHGNLALEEPIERLLTQGVTAIFCFNDTMAYEAISILNRSGYDVPRDIAIVGYDNIEGRLHIPVHLTTIDTDKKELTRRAIHMLMRRIDDFDAPMMKRVNEAKLIVRKTG
jgi:LacI family transcriptional regulator